MGFLKKVGNALGELDKGINIGNVLGELDKGINSLVDGVSNIAEGTKAVNNTPYESEGQGIWPVIPTNICFYCGAELEENAENCSVCHSKLK